MARTTTIRATKQTTGALRAIAARLGYTALTGPFAGGGDAAAMLEAIVRGELEVVRQITSHTSAHTPPDASAAGDADTAAGRGKAPPSEPEC